MLKSLKTTLKAFPIITVVAVSLCFITTELFDLLLGIKLPEQSIVAAMRYIITHAFDSIENFLNCASALAQVLVLVPVVEEILFRWLLFMLPLRLVGKRYAAGGGAAPLLLPAVRDGVADEHDLYAPGGGLPHLLGMALHLPAAGLPVPVGRRDGANRAEGSSRGE